MSAVAKHAVQRARVEGQDAFVRIHNPRAVDARDRVFQYALIPYTHRLVETDDEYLGTRDPIEGDLQPFDWQPIRGGMRILYVTEVEVRYDEVDEDGRRYLSPTVIL